MGKRLKFVRGADEFVDRGVTFVKGGPGQEVEDDRYEALVGLVGYDFEEESDEEYQERVAAAEKLREEEAAAEAEQAEARQAEIDAAQRTADFFNAETVAEQEEKGVPAPDSGHAATDQGIGDDDDAPGEAADDAPDETSDEAADDESGAGRRRGTRGRSFE